MDDAGCGGGEGDIQGSMSSSAARRRVASIWARLGLALGAPGPLENSRCWLMRIVVAKYSSRIEPWSLPFAGNRERAGVPTHGPLFFRLRLNKIERRTCTMVSLCLAGTGAGAWCHLMVALPSPAAPAAAGPIHPDGAFDGTRGAHRLAHCLLAATRFTERPAAAIQLDK